MELFRILTVIFIFFGDSMIIYGQSLLGAVENIFGLDDGPSDNERYTTAPAASPNINYQVRSNILGSNPNLYNKVPNTRPNLGRSNNFPNNKLQNGLTNSTINLSNQKNPPRIQNSIMQKVNQGNYEDDDVKLAAQQFPSLQKLLDNLKELNRQKESDKQKGLHKENGQATAAPTTTEKINTSESKPKHNEKFKAMRKRKFYFQVKPVVPENERKDKDMETVYYDD